ncbi:MAG: septum formation initiator family protein [Firmicutes bacterium]|nr:septum formation initiator family protein [Bacillota bacterium]
MIVAQERSTRRAEVPEYRAPARRARARQEDKLMITGLVFLAFLLGVLLVFYYSQVSAVGKQLTELEAELVALRAESEHLEATISGYSSLGRLEQLARDHLGMVEPTRKEALALAPPAPREEGAIGREGEKEPEPNAIIAAFAALIDRVEQRVKPTAAAETGV